VLLSKKLGWFLFVVIFALLVIAFVFLEKPEVVTQSQKIVEPAPVSNIQGNSQVKSPNQSGWSSTLTIDKNREAALLGISPSSSDTQPAQLLVENDQQSAAHKIAMERLNKIRSESKRGGERLQDFVKQQPIELKDLFKNILNPNTKVVSTDPFAIDYKKHLAHDRDPEWSDEAERFLSNYFVQANNANVSISRIDCWGQSCEVAGLIYGFEADEHDWNSVLRSNQVRGYIFQDKFIFSSEFDKYFSNTINLNFVSPDKSINQPIPFSAIIGRVWEVPKSNL